MSTKMKMGDRTVTGNLADDPREVSARDGRTFTAMRVVENQRTFDREQQQWVDGEAVGYDVAIQNDRLRQHALHGLSKGDRVTVRGTYEVGSYVNKNSGEAGLNHRIGARDVSVSMFDDRFDPSMGVDSEPRHREIHEQTWKEQGLAERASLSGRGTPPPPGVPEQTASVELGAPTPEQRREVAERQQRAAESWSVAQQQQQMPQQGFSSPSL